MWNARTIDALFVHASITHNTYRDTPLPKGNVQNSAMKSHTCSSEKILTHDYLHRKRCKSSPTSIRCLLASHNIHHKQSLTCTRASSFDITCHVFPWRQGTHAESRVFTKYRARLVCFPKFESLLSPPGARNDVFYADSSLHSHRELACLNV